MCMNCVCDVLAETQMLGRHWCSYPPVAGGLKIDVVYLLEWAVKRLSACDCLNIMLLISLVQRCSKIQEALAGMRTDLNLLLLAQWPNKKL